MHDPTKVLLGTTQSSAKDIAVYNNDPASFPAGLAVRLASTGLLALAKASGMFVGISLGKSLSDTKKTAVVRTGDLVPIQLTNAESDPEEPADYDYVVIGEKVWVDDVTGMANIEDDGDVTTTITDAVYVSGVLDGTNEAGEVVKVALVSMPGGL